LELIAEQQIPAILFKIEKTTERKAGGNRLEEAVPEFGNSLFYL